MYTLFKRQQANRFGAQSEALATSYLEQQGLRVVQANYTCRFGEIDRIMVDGDTLVFVEVKARRDSAIDARNAVLLRESITPHKQARLLRAAEHFLRTHVKWHTHSMRFDCVLVHKQGENHQLEWLQDIFTAST